MPRLQARRHADTHARIILFTRSGEKFLIEGKKAKKESRKKREAEEAERGSGQIPGMS